MSASREKKQRQDDFGQGLTQKQIKDRKEAMVKKRNRILYAVGGVVAAILVIALLVWNSGIFQKSTVAATVGDQKFTVVDVSYYYYQAINQQYNMYQQLAAYGMSVPFDLSLPLGEQYVDAEKTKTYQQQFQETALENLKETAAFCAEAAKAGYTLSEEGQTEIDAVLAQIDAVCAKSNITRGVYLNQSYGRFMTEKVFLKNLTESVLSGDFQKNHQEGLTYTDEQFQDYYKENAKDLDSYSFRFFLIDGVAPAPTDADGNPQKDAEGNTVEASDAEKTAALAAAKDKADAAIAEIEAGNSSETVFATTAAKYVSEDLQEDFKADPNSSLVDNQVGSTFSSQPYGAWVTESGRTKGDLTAIEAPDSGYYVVMFLNRALDESATADIRHILIKAETPVDDPATTDKDESQEPPTAEALSASKTKAQELLDQWNAGDKTVESFSALAEENSADTGSAANGGLIENVYEGQTFPGFNDWVLDPARKTGDVTLVENPQAGQQGWHVIYFQDWADPVWYTTTDNALRTKDQTDWKTASLEPYTATATNGMTQVGR